MDDSTTKRCPKCGQDKPRSEFHKNRKRVDGLASWCKACFSALDRVRNVTPERIANRRLSPDERIAEQKRRAQEWEQEIRQRRAALSKACSCCGLKKPTADFQKNCHELDGLQHWCTACRHNHDQQPDQKQNRSQYDQQRRAEKGDQLRAHSREKYRTDPEHRERIRQDYLKRKETPEYKERERQRHYKRWANPEHRRKAVAYARNRRHNDPEYRMKVWFWRQDRRARIKRQGVPFTYKEWIDLCERYDHRCLCCGEKKPLTRDHVVPVSKDGASDISNIQPLCLDCNRKKNARTIDYRTPPL